MELNIGIWDVGTVVLHTPTGVIGMVVWNYPAGEFRDAGGNPIHVPVVELSTGDCFLAIQDGSATCEPLTPMEVGIHDTLQHHFNKTREMASIVAKCTVTTPERANIIWRAVLNRMLKQGLT